MFKPRETDLLQHYGNNEKVDIIRELVGYIERVEVQHFEKGKGKSNQSAANQYAQHVRLMPALFHHIRVIATPSFGVHAIANSNV